MSVRSTHKGFGSSHVLPPNPIFLDFPRSDGSTSKWPLNTTCHVDSEGHVNFMREVPLDEPLAIKWRIEVGAVLATRLNMAPGHNYVLRGWPEGYQMFDHNKGPKDNPRHDAYLMGSTHAKRFRSVPEFIPHALWLLTDPALDRSNCSCKYCNKKPQREITASMGLLPKRGGSTPTSTRSAPPPPKLKRQPQLLKEKNPLPDREKLPREREKDKPYVGVRRPPKLAKQPAPKQSMLRERNSDLSSAYGPEVSTRRWFREGELLWCALNPAIEGPSGPGGDDSILFWPGIVEETRMKPIPIPKDTIMDESDRPRPSTNINLSDGEVPWTIQHVLSYKMKLLGVSHSFYVPDDQVLPYQSIVPPDELIQAIHDVPIEDLQRDPARTSAFNPYSISGEKLSFPSAAASYGIALQVGANIAGYWAPTDDWEFKFVVEHPNAGIPPPQRPSSTFQSLDSVMNSTMTYNANLTTSLATPSASGSNTPNIPATLPSLAPGQTITQTRYQGLWWGAERIWTDELIRLKFSRAQVAPKGNEFIYAPARPSKKAQEYAQVMSGDIEVGGAETRGVFMRLEGLYISDSPTRGGSKVCHAVGTLYELVDEDWEEEDSLESEVVEGKGKGKANANGIASADGTPVVDGVTAGLSFMSAPSPFKPPPLANPDPAVPIGSTTTDVLSHGNIPWASSSSSSAPKHSANDALSRPVLSSPFPLPEAPEGFKFRPILKPNTELIVDLTWIAGRYYPGLLKHKLLDRHVERALASGGMQLWALEGLTPGYYNAMDPTKWRATRTLMVREADREARVGLEKHWENKEKERREAKLIEDSFLPPVPPSGLDSAEGSGLGPRLSTTGTTGQGSNGDAQGVQNGGTEGFEWRALANGMLEDNAMSID
ncbi:hypothetical protein AZE42_09195 [Rhizopogon vesiculosus]|uniref:Cryptic loci regulator 2 N-terminal domain-containing protein n=1 Tax=Rhizopogon vesiculosus TaxID=180088 RepID=A0A1J8Q5E7_9AGAM|nr:hypothetical protein AZE42_09195 [Rhizopogon vesiculosus]